MTPLAAALARLAADEAGLEPAAIDRAAIARFVARSARSGVGADALWARARAREPRLVEGLLSAILVGETFFFREPAHFRLVRDVIAARPEPPRLGLSAWSAGCASGEEAYSLAATLRAVAGGLPVEVLGTDLSARALAGAAAGVYGKWSRREAGPMLYPIGATRGDALRVGDELRALVRYARHNLLDPPPSPPGGFDIVMCRNVLVYLRADAARRVTRHLCDSLAPGGLLILGTFGAVDDPAFAPIGPRELGAYEHRVAPRPPAELSRNRAQDPRDATRGGVNGPACRARGGGKAPSRSIQDLSNDCWTGLEPPADHVKVHLEAIHLIEARRLAEAAVLLAALVGRASYAPALLELALIEERRGQPARAAELATRLLEQLGGRDPDDVVAGPEALPVQYYTTSAHTFLARLRRRA